MPLEAARTIISAAREVVDAGLARLAADSQKNGRIDVELMDREQQLAYDLASAASRVTAAEEMLAYGEQGEHQAQLTLAFTGEMAADLTSRIAGRERDWDLAADAAWRSDAVADAFREARSTALLEELGEKGPAQLRTCPGTSTRTCRWCGGPSRTSPSAR